MLTDNQKAWVAALRSGEYRQGTGKLVSADGSMCCLGVACDLYEKTVGPITKPDWRKFGSNLSAAPEVRKWLGLVDICGIIPGQYALTEMNDTGSSFAIIAETIESEPEGLFA